jgi:hypothetical protein
VVAKRRRAAVIGGNEKRRPHAVAGAFGQRRGWLADVASGRA